MTSRRVHYPNDLTLAEVKARLKAADGSVTDELCEFGSAMVAEVLARQDKLENKAAAIAGFGVGLIVLLLSSVEQWGGMLSWWASAAVFVSGACGGAAVLMAAIGIRVGKRQHWYSQNDWLRTECLRDLRLLKQFRIVAMWDVINSHEAACIRKAQSIRSAQLWLGIATVLVLVALLNAAWKLGAVN